jgi:hypothetical protein
MGGGRGSILKLPTLEPSQNLTGRLASNYGKSAQTKVVLMHIPERWKGGENQMKKIIALVMGIAFAFGTAGFVAAQTPAPKAEDKKADDTTKGDKMEKKGGKKKGGTKKEDKDKTEKKTEDKK